MAEAFYVHMTTYKVYYVIVEYGLFLQEQSECLIVLSARYKQRYSQNIQNY